MTLLSGIVASPPASAIGDAYRRLRRRVDALESATPVRVRAVHAKASLPIANSMTRAARSAFFILTGAFFARPGYQW